MIKKDASVLHQCAVGTLTSAVQQCPLTSNLHLKEPFATPSLQLLVTFWDHIYHHTWRLHVKASLQHQCMLPRQHLALTALRFPIWNLQKQVNEGTLLANAEVEAVVC